MFMNFEVRFLHELKHSDLEPKSECLNLLNFIDQFYEYYAPFSIVANLLFSASLQCENARAALSRAFFSASMEPRMTSCDEKISEQS